MKQLFTLCLGSIFAVTTLHAQTIAVSQGQDTGNDALDFNASNDPYFVQFGVSGTSAAATDINTESIAGAAPLSTTAVSEFGNSVGEQTQFTSGITLSYNDGTSPTNSTTTTVTNESGATGTANAVSVQTGFTGNATTEQRSGQGLMYTITFNEAISSANLSFLFNDYNSLSTITYTLTGATSVSATNPSGPVQSENDIFTQNVSLSNIAAGATLTVSDLQTGIPGGPTGYDNISATGFAVTSLMPATVPEPSTYALMLGGVTLLFGMLRFRNRLA